MRCKEMGKASKIRHFNQQSAIRGEEGMRADKPTELAIRAEGEVVEG